MGERLICFQMIQREKYTCVRVRVYSDTDTHRSSKWHTIWTPGECRWVDGLAAFSQLFCGSEVFMMQKMQGVGGLKFTLQEAGYTGCLQATGWLEERRRRHMLTDVYTSLCLLNFESKLVWRLWVIVKLNLESNKGLRIIYTEIKFVFKNLLLCNMNAL